MVVVTAQGQLHSLVGRRTKKERRIGMAIRAGFFKNNTPSLFIGQIFHFW
jgi:hypothetical protein